MFTKRAFDILAALLGLAFLFPLLLVIALWIRADSPGPVFYRGVRIGFGGKRFRIYKFRTMVVNAEKLGSTATAYKDPRITGVGNWIRYWKLDELPQLINVLLGDMSIVGPRPEVEEHTSEYTPEDKIILTVRPGITDEASIRFINLSELLGSINANQVYLDKYRAEKNRLRVEYVQNRSFWNDLKIIFRTISHLFTRRPSGT